MNATIESIANKTTQHELEDGYRNLIRVLGGTQPAHAVSAALNLAKVDVENLWKFLKSYASTDLNYKDTQPLLVVNALHSNWVQDPKNDVFLSHAVATLANATKNRNDSVLKLMPNRY